MLNPTKCEFGVKEVDFLGHRINHNGGGPATTEDHRSHGVSATKDSTKPPRVYRHGKFLPPFHSTGCRQTAPFILRHPTTETRPSMRSKILLSQECKKVLAVMKPRCFITHAQTHPSHSPPTPRMQQPVPSSQSM